MEYKDEGAGDSSDERRNTGKKAVSQDKDEGYRRCTNHRHEIVKHHRGNVTARVTLEWHAAVLAGLFEPKEAFKDVALSAFRTVTA